MSNDPIIIDMLDKPLWQLTGKEYVALHAYAAKRANEKNDTLQTTTRCTGVRELAQYLNCCESTIYGMKREGVLDDAILSSIGKSTVFDGEKARELAQAYMQEHRKTNIKRTMNRTQ